jgi:hypothetical protein
MTDLNILVIDNLVKLWVNANFFDDFNKFVGLKGFADLLLYKIF